MAWHMGCLEPALGPEARKLTQLIANGHIYGLVAWLSSVDGGFASLVLPSWGVLLLAQIHQLAVVRLHAHLLPQHSLLAPSLKLQCSIVLLPWLIRRFGQRLKAREQLQRLKAKEHSMAAAEQAAGDNDGRTGSSSSSKSYSSVASTCTASVPGLDVAQPKVKVPTAGACSAACAALLQPPRAYVSVLGPDVAPICIKIASPHLEPEHLAPNAPAQLAHAILDASSRVGHGMQVLALSVRHGCILIGMQGVQRSLPPAGTSPDESTRAMSFAQQLLPGLLRDLGLAPDAGSLSQLMGPGTCLSLQLGTQLLQATYEPHTGEWHTAAQKLPVLQQWQVAGSGGAVRPPQLGLARQLCAVSGTDASTTVNSSSTPGSSCGAVTCMVLEVAVSCPAGTAGVRVTAGSAAAAAPDGCDTLQLCVQAADDFLPVRVLQQTPSANGTRIMVQVEVEMQPDDGLLVVHHPGGPLAAVQPLSLQLWCGRLLLSTTHTLVSMGQAPAAAAAGAGVFGWWGIPVAGAMAAAAELDVETQRVLLLQGEAGAAAQAAHQSLLRDMCFWLAGVRHAACSSGWCACPLAGNASLSLTHPQLQALAHSLAQFAAERGFQALHAMVQQQARRVLRRPPRALHAAVADTQQQPVHQRAWQAAAEAGSRLRTSLLGHSCPQCEAVAQEGMRAYMAYVSLWARLPVAIGAVLIIARQEGTWRRPVSWLLGLWAALHLLLGLATLLPPHSGPAPTGSPTRMGNASHRGDASHMGNAGHMGPASHADNASPRAIARWQLCQQVARWLRLLPSAIKLVVMLIVGASHCHRPAAIARQHQSGRWVPLQLAPMLTDHLCLLGHVPQRYVTLTALLEFGAGLLLNSQSHGVLQCVGGTLLVTLLLPVLAGLHIRARAAGQAGQKPQLPHQWQQLLRSRAHGTLMKLKHA